METSSTNSNVNQTRLKTPLDICRKQIFEAIVQNRKIVYCDPTLTSSDIEYLRNNGYKVFLEPDYVLGQKFNNYRVELS